MAKRKRKAVIPTDNRAERWLAHIDDLIIQRELQATRLVVLTDRLEETGVRRPSVGEAQKRIERAVARLSEHRAALLALARRSVGNGRLNAARAPARQETERSC